MYAEVGPASQQSGKPAIKRGKTIDRLRAALEKTSRIDVHRYPITLAYADNDLVLSGELEHIAAKKVALQFAAAIAPGTAIVDRLRVKPAEFMSDAQLCDHVIKALLEEPALKRCLLHSRLPRQLLPHRGGTPDPIGTIVVEVRDGVVMLNGEVPSLSHKRLAGVLAWWVAGCRDVINGLAEVPAQQDNDDELTEAVRLALAKDPLVNATKTRVTSKAGVVTLEGLIPNETMRRMAERDAWYVLGVREVVNQIAVKW
ncbi:MAG: BON domain-containing protein [Candidatus Binatia bacterium]